MIGHHEALIYAMVLVSAADRDMTDSELSTIGQVASHLPVFCDFDEDRLPEVARDCATVLQHGDGLDRALDLILTGLPEHLRETAYALACEVAAADGRVVIEETRVLQLIRERLMIDRLSAAAVERGIAARHRMA